VLFTVLIKVRLPPTLSELTTETLIITGTLTMLKLKTLFASFSSAVHIFSALSF
jgi:hypothetical protein